MPLLISMLFIVCLLIILGIVNTIIFKFLNKRWWQIPWLRNAFITFQLVGMIVATYWYIIFLLDLPVGLIKTIVGMLTYFVLITNGLLILGFLISGLINSLNDFIEKVLHKKKDNIGTIERSRRLLFKSIATGFPTAILASNTYFIATAFKEPRIRSIPLKYNNIPKDIEGLTFLLLSDLHLGIFLTLQDLKGILARLGNRKFDFIFVTGDIADDLKLLHPALWLINSIETNYGTYASVGNHEHYIGIDKVIKIFDKSEVTLLRNSGKYISIGNTNIYLGGADDPKTALASKSKHSMFFEHSISQAFKDTQLEAFRILLSHRPIAFEWSHKYDIQLTLAGHTHGTQFGYNGRSLFEGITDNKYLWGLYRKGEHLCYTTSGAGHWMPFRCGCPTEVCIFTLTHANNNITEEIL